MCFHMLSEALPRVVPGKMNPSASTCVGLKRFGPDELIGWRWREDGRRRRINGTMSGNRLGRDCNGLKLFSELCGVVFWPPTWRRLCFCLLSLSALQLVRNYIFISSFRNFFLYTVYKKSFNQKTFLNQSNWACIEIHVFFLFFLNEQNFILFLSGI